MTCNECFEAFSSALDGELAPDERAAMTEHLESCSDCRHLQTRMLALSAELKAQPFPNPSDESLKQLTQNVLASTQTVRWSWLRRGLKLPYENWILRSGLRLFSFGSLVLLVFWSAISERLLPLYNGAEAVSKSSFLGAASWFDWSPSPQLLYAASLGAFVVGLWTCGLPGLILDLWSGTRLSKRDLLRFGLGTLCLGPIFALPLVALLEFGAYLFVCCLWSGLCLVSTYLFIAFKTRRPLPRLAIDFVVLTLLLGLLEWLARSSLRTSHNSGSLAITLELLAGHLSLPMCLKAFSLIALGFLFCSVGVTGLIRSYRSSPNRLLPIILLLVGLTCSVSGVQAMNLITLALQPRVEIAKERRAYLLGSAKEHPWILSEVNYPALELAAQSLANPQKTARANLSIAYLNWDDEALLSALTSWADNSPGVLWGLTAVTDSLGQRQKNVIAVSTEQRRRTIAHLLKTLTWRRLQDVVLSQDRGSVNGRLQAKAGVALRLIKLDPNESLSDTVEILEQEPILLREQIVHEQTGQNFSLPQQRTAQTDEEGRFSFSRVPDGRYVLAILSDQPSHFTLNSSIPGVFEITDGAKIELDTIRLTVGEVGTDVDLSANRWQATGSVSFSGNSELTTAKIEAKSSITGFVDSKVFAGGRARIKFLTRASSFSSGTLVAKFYSRDGRLLREWQTPIADRTQLNELDIDSRAEEGYLQLIISCQTGQLTVQTIKLEVVSRG